MLRYGVNENIVLIFYNHFVFVFFFLQISKDRNSDINDNIFKNVKKKSITSRKSLFYGCLIVIAVLLGNFFPISSNLYKDLLPTDFYYTLFHANVECFEDENDVQIENG